jgi:hypothetical protein
MLGKKAYHFRELLSAGREINAHVLDLILHRKSTTEIDQRKFHVVSFSKYRLTRSNFAFQQKWKQLLHVTRRLNCTSQSAFDPVYFRILDSHETRRIPLGVGMQK